MKRQSHPRRWWIDRGKEAILAVLEQEAAVTVAELEARISEGGQGGGLTVEPIHLTTARRELERGGRIILSPPIPTRGGQSIPLYHLPSRRGSLSRTLRASARKRLLHARYISWTRASRRHPHGLIGEAGERVVRASFRAPSVSGLYAMTSPKGADVTHVLGGPVPIGPLDEAGWYGGSVSGVPGAPILIVVEVKNTRAWLNPSDPEVHQVLAKAAAMQQANPAVRLLPVLICRERLVTTRRMAEDLGLYIIDLHQQYVLPSAEVDERLFEEVRTELGFASLVRTAEASPVLVKLLAETVPAHAERMADCWAAVGSGLGTHYDLMRRSKSPVFRGTVMKAIRAAAKAQSGSDFGGGW